MAWPIYASAYPSPQTLHNFQRNPAYPTALTLVNANDQRATRHPLSPPLQKQIQLRFR
jgi:hypothetical protein